MRKTKLFKNILAGTLVFSLMFSGAAPVMAASENSIEAETEAAGAENTEAGDTEADREEETEKVVAIWEEETEKAVTEDAESYEQITKADNETGDDATGKAAITDLQIYADPYSSWIEFELTYTGTNCDYCSLTVTDPEGKIAYSTSYYVSGRSIDSDDFDEGLKAGEYTFTLTPYNEDGAAGEAKSVTYQLTAPATPSITEPAISTTSYSSYIIFRLTYTATDCSRCGLTVTDPEGTVVYNDSSYTSDRSIDSDDFDESLAADKIYTFTLTPYNSIGGIGVYGEPKSVTWTAPAVPAATGLAVREQTSSEYIFTCDNMPEGAGLRLEYSENAAFDSKLAEVYGSSGSLSYDELTPGVNYYVRACLRLNGITGAYSDPITVTAPVAEVTGITTEIGDTAITLTISTDGIYTGFEISRKSGSKYQVLSNSSSRVYTDAGLKKDTKYSYRVRAVYYDINTKKTAYGEYAYVTAETGGAALNLKADAAGKTSIKLTWDKVAGAAGYEVYRRTGYSSGRTGQSGESYNFSKYELVKDLGKNKKSYTDKKLTAGEGYTYIVKAYKKVKGKKEYFTWASAGAETKFDFNTTVNVYKQAQNPSTGKMSIAWKQIPQADGYLIEKYDNETYNWVQETKITKANQTSYTLPASPEGTTIRYRIRAYKGKKYTNAATVSVTGYIQVVTGVKAQAAAEGIQVSWDAVPGASYYRVYRTMDEHSFYNSDLKTYSYYNASEVTPKVFVTTDENSHNYQTIGTNSAKMTRDNTAEQNLQYSYSYYDDDDDWTYRRHIGVTGTSITDYNYSTHYETYDDTTGVVTKDNVTLYGPQAGVQYYYYVVAYKDLDSGNDTGSHRMVSSYGSSKAASAAYAGGIEIKAPTVTVKAAKKKATITIKKVENADSYAIFRSTKKNGAYELVTITNKTSYTDSGLTAKKTYYYKVKAIGKNAMGTDLFSSFSAAKSAKIK